jgi:hypothetical protein
VSHAIHTLPGGGQPQEIDQLRWQALSWLLATPYQYFRAPFDDEPVLRQAPRLCDQRNLLNAVRSLGPRASWKSSTSKSFKKAAVHLVGVRRPSGPRPPIQAKRPHRDRPARHPPPRPQRVQKLLRRGAAGNGVVLGSDLLKRCVWPSTGELRIFRGDDQLRRKSTGLVAANNLPKTLETSSLFF